MLKKFFVLIIAVSSAYVSLAQDEPAAATEERRNLRTTITGF
jgi:hypothetical protein